MASLPCLLRFITTVSTHPPIDSLARFATGLLPAQETVTVALHVASCPTCQAAATRPQPGLRPGPAGEPTSPYAAAIRRVAERSGRRAARHERQTRRAPSLLDQLLALPTESWDRAIRSSPKFHSYAFARQLLVTCRAGWTHDPKRSERLATLALQVANRLRSAEHGRRNLEDLRSRAWAHIGNCRSIRSAYTSVPDALQRSVEHLHAGTGNERDRAELLRVTCSYFAYMGWAEQAREVYSEGLDIAVDLRDKALQVSLLVHGGQIELTAGHPGRALFALSKAARIQRTFNNPGMTAILTKYRALMQAETEDPRRGLATFRSVDRGALAGLGKMDLARFAWGEAMIHRELGDLGRAIASLDAACRSLVEVPSPVNWGCACLDLAQLHLEIGQPDRSLRLVTETFPVFAFQGLEIEMLDALDLFRQAGGIDAIATP